MCAYTYMLSLAGEHFLVQTCFMFVTILLIIMIGIMIIIICYCSVVIGIGEATAPSRGHTLQHDWPAHELKGAFTCTAVGSQ